VPPGEALSKCSRLLFRAWKIAPSSKHSVQFSRGAERRRAGLPPSSAALRENFGGGLAEL